MIVFVDLKKMSIKVDDEKKIKKVFFLNSDLKHSCSIDLFGIYVYKFDSRVDFNKFREAYKFEVDHEVFMRELYSGGYDCILSEGNKYIKK